MEKRVRRTNLNQRISRSIHILLFVTYFLTLAVLLTFVNNYFKTYFYNSLLREGQIAAQYYENNIASGSTLGQVIYDDQDSWWQSSIARVQIYDPTGMILLDSQGYLEQASTRFDVNAALTKGIVEYDIFRLENTREHVMSVSLPLKSAGQIVGAIRYIGSLRPLDEYLFTIASFFFAIAGVITLISLILSSLMSRRILAPIGDLTEAAQSMAQGNYQIKSPVYSNDEIGTLSQTFNAMVAEVAKKEELKNDFISTVSHELRTPLTAIKGWSATLKDPATDHELNKMGLEIIEKEADRLQSMVNDLLDFSKFAAGKIELQKTKVDPMAIKQFVESFVEGRKERNAKVVTFQMDDSVAPFMADENRIKQVLINLVDNAFKFTDADGQIKVIIKQDDRRTIFQVQDNGVGISPEDLPRVREKFFHGRHLKSSSGIGLSIVNEVAQLHGGELLIDSRLGKGTLMTVTIPRGGSHEEC